MTLNATYTSDQGRVLVPVVIPTSQALSSSIATCCDQLEEMSFFTNFPDFDHDPAASILEEFERLTIHRQWKRGGERWKKERNRCLNEEFEHHYTAGVTVLDQWQGLCRELSIDPVPGTITQCKKVRAGYHLLSSALLTTAVQ